MSPHNEFFIANSETELTGLCFHMGDLGYELTIQIKFPPPTTLPYEWDICATPAVYSSWSSCGCVSHGRPHISPPTVWLIWRHRPPPQPCCSLPQQHRSFPPQLLLPFFRWKLRRRLLQIFRWQTFLLENIEKKKCGSIDLKSHWIQFSATKQRLNKVLAREDPCGRRLKK